jgi:hypothetical protein
VLTGGVTDLLQCSSMSFRRAGADPKVSISAGDDASRIHARMSHWRPDDQDALVGWTAALNGLYHEALQNCEYGYDWSDTLTAHGTIDAVDVKGMRNKVEVEVRLQPMQSCGMLIIVSGLPWHVSSVMFFCRSLVLTVARSL